MSDSPSQILSRSDVEAEIDSPDPPPVKLSQRLRYVELGLVLFVALAGSVSLSVYTLFSGAHLYGSNPSPALNFGAVIQELAGLGVLFYVLFRQRRSPGYLGLTFSWTDLPLSVGLAFMALLAEVVAWQLLSHGYRQATGQNLDTTPQNVEFIASSFAIWTLILVIVNPFFEELIVRAYLISEVQSLTGSSVIAVVLRLFFSQLTTCTRGSHQLFSMLHYSRCFPFIM